MADDDDIMFADDDEEEDSSANDSWKVMIVDDDEEVHTVTRLVLGGLTFHNKSIQLQSAYSGAEAKKAIVENPDTALMLLDVVMETEQAGLDVVKFVREEANNKMVRIVLRTGQPGQAPEKDVIDNYDINDYKEKTELTSQKLYSLLYSTLRSYRDIKIIKDNKLGLEKLIEVSKHIFEMQGMQTFSALVLKQLTCLMGLNDDAMYCKTSGFAAHLQETKADNEECVLEILAANGVYNDLDTKVNLSKISDALAAKIKESLTKKQHIFDDDYIVMYFDTVNGGVHIVCVGDLAGHQISSLDEHLLGVFGSNIAIGLENVYLRREVDETQNEIIHSLSGAVETRSKETGYHIKRVALMTEFVAQKYGFAEVEKLKLASVMHDLGKVAIPDSILNKPGKLTNEEWEIMKTHSQLGYDILKSSKRPVIQMGASIALEHHEKWDGTGYPQGLKGEEISIEGRILAIVDVFDALASKRCYKNPWPLEKVIEFISSQSGKHFDKDIADIVLNNVDEFNAICDKYQDSKH